MSVYKNDDATYLQRALTSVFDEQTVKPDEIVVVFDGPLTAELYEVLDEFKRGKETVVFYYPQEVNKGLGEALRVGSEYCSGDYIFRMDSDDISHPLRFEKQISYVETNPQIDVLGTNIAEFYTSPDEEKMRVRACPSEHKDIVKMSKKRNPMNHVTACIKKTALRKCGGYESLLLVEDYYLWLKMIVAGCILGNINESLVYVRIGNGFHSKRGSANIIKGWKHLQKYMIKNGLINRTRAFANMVRIRVFVHCPAKIKKTIYEKYLRE